MEEKERLETQRSCARIPDNAKMEPGTVQRGLTARRNTMEGVESDAEHAMVVKIGKCLILMPALFICTVLMTIALVQGIKWTCESGYVMLFIAIYPTMLGIVLYCAFTHASLFLMDGHSSQWERL